MNIQATESTIHTIKSRSMYFICRGYKIIKYLVHDVQKGVGDCIQLVELASTDYKNIRIRKKNQI